MDGNSCVAAQATNSIDVPSHDEAWYIVRLKPGGLSRAQQNLSRQGIVSFCPHRRRTERRNGRLVTGLKPLFPGYLFICVPSEGANWRSINATYGVAKVVCLEPGRPSRVPTDLVKVLIDFETAEDGAVEVFSPGEEVRVIVGPFAEIIARVEAAPEKDRVLILLSMMGRAVRTEVRTADLERT
ncbi:transcriptional activator RfaH [Roseibacterium sp. SDUM158016]|uniref:transcription termination/antitermination protein NusG n=1 Tax=Roseicyclus sediminis TaxID=2980997 RepID=UPI0021CFBC47|nr:transcription termination/antitermination NusG family protein [Roseibacterium sp. SDUM158016]MCU4653749.1 transcriptional activator RfaH [Roseibacterium sp. SDUM158016]